MRNLLLVSAIAVAVMMGCAVRQPVEMQTQFDYDQHKPYTLAGNNGIKGQGFLRQQGGGIITCAGSPVYLMPATPFFREIIGHFRAGKNPQLGAQLDPAYKPMIKQSQCDAQGNFSFAQLPDGAWFVATEVKWIVSSLQQGGALMREVRLSQGETSQVLLTEKDFIGR
jgi:hypothetical protein